jgi:hypothetical protein
VWKWAQPDHLLLRRYLVGDVTSAEQERIENRFFQDAAVFECLLAAEAALFDDYVRGELTERELTAFRARFLTSNTGRRGADAARVLFDCLAEQREQDPTALPSSTPTASNVTSAARSPWNSWLTAAAAIVVAIGTSVWLLLDHRRLTAEVTSLQAERARLVSQERIDADRARTEADRLARELAGQRAARELLARDIEARQRSGTIATVLLTPGTRGDRESAQSVLLAPDTRHIAIGLEIGEASYDEFRIVVRTLSGEGVWQQNLSRPAPAVMPLTLTITLPATSLSPGDYLVVLQGRTRSSTYSDIGAYYFRAASP